jgi:hypothetical protein
VDDPPPLPDVVVQDANQLRALLWARAAGEPHIYTVRSLTDCPPYVFDHLSLFLGGGPWGLVSRMWQIGSIRTYRTVQRGGPGNPEPVWYQDGREGVYMQPGELLPAAEVIDAAAYFVTHGELSPLLQWVGWDSEW